MNANDYQKLASRTLINRPDFEISDLEIMIAWNALGLSGETGEVVDHIKKGIFHQHRIDLLEIADEIGDVLWYVAALCTTLNLDMSVIMERNIEKLKVRYPDEYSSVDSKRRKDSGL